MRKAIISIVSLVAAGFMYSCSDSCTKNKNALPLAAYYEAADSTIQKFTPDSIEVTGIGRDSVLSPATAIVDELHLPFRIDSDTTGYKFVQKLNGSERSSSVTFIYSRTPRFVDAECGVSYIFDIRKIECTGNLIDSVTCPTGFIDNTDAENLRIYIRPR